MTNINITGRITRKNIKTTTSTDSNGNKVSVEIMYFDVADNRDYNGRRTTKYWKGKASGDLMNKLKETPIGAFGTFNGIWLNQTIDTFNGRISIADWFKLKSLAFTTPTPEAPATSLSEIIDPETGEVYYEDKEVNEDELPY